MEKENNTKIARRHVAHLSHSLVGKVGGAAADFEETAVGVSANFRGQQAFGLDGELLCFLVELALD